MRQILCATGSRDGHRSRLTQPRIVVFCMPVVGHFQLLRPLISGLVRHGADVHVITDRRFEQLVHAEGATFADLFARHSLDEADDSSMPYTCRYVSYAGAFAEQHARDVAALQPSLIICETFALIGRVVAERLGIPWVNVSPGHDLDPVRYVQQLHSDSRVNVSESCHRAVATLRAQHAIPDASPFSFVTSMSPSLNIYCEPPSFLEEDRRRVFEPLAFFGCLPSDMAQLRPRGEAQSSFVDASRLKVYISFGTVVWRYYRAEAMAALQVMSAYFDSRPDAEVLISLGGASLAPDECSRLARTNVRVASYVDQWAVLRETDVFVTHHGINSTHEAIINLVPMLSYPFFWDQPTLAAKCQQLGLAVPLGELIRGPLSGAAVDAALRELFRDADARRASLQRARDAEIRVIAERETVFERVLALAGATP